MNILKASYLKQDGFMTVAYHPESVLKVQKVCQNLKKYE